MNKGDIAAVKLRLTAVIGEKDIPVDKLAEMGEGSIIELDNMAGEPVDIWVGGETVAKGEVVVIDENFGVRITEVNGQVD